MKITLAGHVIAFEPQQQLLMLEATPDRGGESLRILHASGREEAEGSFRLGARSPLPGRPDEVAGDAEAVAMPVPSGFFAGLPLLAEVDVWDPPTQYRTWPEAAKGQFNFQRVCLILKKCRRRHKQHSKWSGGLQPPSGAAIAPQRVPTTLRARWGKRFRVLASVLTRGRIGRTASYSAYQFTPSAGTAPTRIATATTPPLRRYSLSTPELNLLAETAMTTVTTPPIAQEYIWFGGQPVAQLTTTTSEIAWYFNDHLGTPLLQTDAAANVRAVDAAQQLQQLHRQHFQEVQDLPASNAEPDRAGQLHDGEWSTGLRRNGHLIEERMRASTTRWSLAFVLLAVSIWTANLTLFNWWAAGGPPTLNPQQYVMRGNIFAAATLVLFGSAVGLGVFNWKRRIR